MALDADLASAHTADHLGRRAGPRAGAVVAPVRAGGGAARAHRRAGASDDAADQAHVVRATTIRGPGRTPAGGWVSRTTSCCGLTGRLVTELSSASGTGLLDMSTRTWSTKAIELCGVSADRLPRDPAHHGDAADWLPPRRAQDRSARRHAVVVGAGDGPLGNLGTGAMAPGVAGLSLGTSGAVRMAVDAPARRLRPDAVLLRADRLGLGHRRRDQQRRRASCAGPARSLAPDVAGRRGRRRVPTPRCSSWPRACPPAATGSSCCPTCCRARAAVGPGPARRLPGPAPRRTPARTCVRAAVEGVCLQMRVDPRPARRGRAGHARSGRPAASFARRYGAR